MGNVHQACVLDEPRVMALFAALCRFAPVINGFAHADLRPIVQSLLHLSTDEYIAAQMSYDLRRLRLKGLIARIPGTHRYVITSYGRRVAVLMTKLHARIFNLANTALATTDDIPSSIARAFNKIDDELDRLVAAAQLSPSQT